MGPCVLPLVLPWVYQNYHQQYDAKPNARGYCGLRPLGVELDISGLEERWTGFVEKGWNRYVHVSRCVFPASSSISQ